MPRQIIPQIWCEIPEWVIKKALRDPLGKDDSLTCTIFVFLDPHKKALETAKQWRRNWWYSPWSANRPDGDPGWTPDMPEEAERWLKNQGTWRTK
jgi:hypothetical protein